MDKSFYIDLRIIKMEWEFWGNKKSPLIQRASNYLF